MPKGYLTQTRKTLDLINERKHVVLEQLRQFAYTDCEKAPDAPCCLLQTELRLLETYSETLERELWHLDHSNDLGKTYEGMVSDDWRERLKAEWAQLCIRMDRLDDFRDAFRDESIDFIPKWDERLLCDQLRAMRTYRDTLLQYAKIEGVELDMSLYNDDYRFDYYFERHDKE